MLQRFHARLVQSSNGTLRWLLLIYLRTYESLRQMLDQRARRKAQQRAIDAKQRGVKEGEQYDFEYDEWSVVELHKPILNAPARAIVQVLTKDEYVRQ